MNKFEELLSEYNDIDIQESNNLPDGLKGFHFLHPKFSMILLNSNIDTIAEKTEILAEELGHYHLNIGDLTDQSGLKNSQQEYRGKAWGIERLISLENIIYLRLKNGLRNVFELANELMVTEDFLIESLAYYKSKYGTYVIVDKHTLNLDTLEIFENVASNELELHRYIKTYKNKNL